MKQRVAVVGRIIAAITALALSSGAGAIRPDQSESAPSHSVTSHQQSGGITAYSIGQVTVTAPQQDPRRLQLAALLNQSHSRSSAQTTQLLAAPVYSFLLSNGVLTSTRQRAETIIIIADDDEYGDMPSACAAGDGVRVYGFRSTGINNDGEMQISATLLGDSDRNITDPICRGLAQPLSAIGGPDQAGTSQRDITTIFDYLSRGTGILTIMLMPEQRFGRAAEDDIFRYYWTMPIAARYFRLPDGAELQQDPAIYGQIAAIGAGRGGSLQFGVPWHAMGDGIAAYPGAATREFGDRILRLDQEWLEFLQASTVTVNTRQTPVVAGHSTTSFLPRFSRGEIGTPRFWRAAHEVTKAAEIANCIAGRFLDAQEYRLSEQQSEHGRCGRLETPLQPPS